MKSTNPFAALDDSGDEAPAAKVVEKKAAKPKPAKVAEPSKVDQKYVVKCSLWVVIPERV